MAYFALALAFQIPFFQEYLKIQNRHLPAWDPALHAKDGLMFYLQALRLDVLSLFYTLINLSFWMPLHPILIAITSVFFPFNLDAYVFLNSIVLSLGLAGASFLFWRSQRPKLLQKTVFSLGSFYSLLRLSNSLAFRQTHYHVMIESLALGLTMMFFTSWMLEDESNEEYLFYSRWTNVFLSLLFFTKIQYGLFFGLAYLTKHLLTHWKELVSEEGCLSALKREWIQKRWLVLISGIFLIASPALAFSGNRADAICFLGFAIVLILSFTPIARKKAPVTLQFFIRFTAIPFGWFYLFPIKNKVRFLLYNSDSTISGEPLLQKLQVLIADFGLFFGMNRYWATFAILSSFLIAWGIRFIMRVQINWSLRSILLAALLFYLPMTFLVSTRQVRFAITWAILFPWIGIFILSELSRWKIGAFAISLTLMVGIVQERLKLPPFQAPYEPVATGFLDPKRKTLNFVLENFDFKRPGIIYGLGKNMDQAIPLLELIALRSHPEYSNVLLKREDRALVFNDFGKQGNQDPAGVILKRANNSELKQIVLYPEGFEYLDFKKVSAGLLQQGFKAVLQNGEILFLTR